MSVSDTDIAFAKELFSALGGITSRRMMGGATLYCDGTIFALIDSEGTIFLKAAGALAEALETASARHFTYLNARTGRTVSMGYWTLPDAALDDAEAACGWAVRALGGRN